MVIHMDAKLFSGSVRAFHGIGLLRSGAFKSTGKLRGFAHKGTVRVDAMYSSFRTSKHAVPAMQALFFIP